MQKINLDPFKQYLISRIKKGAVNGQKLFLEIKDQGINRLAEQAGKLYGTA